ncbi:hypothetical protein FACS1894179_10540 [Bacteroidia bacterium]|nr:hypothetical protein FACS1894179_10540 [Bacteroidia bacterium]
MYLAGFSINVLSMLAIVLAVGLVVDDAIIVTENIYLKIEGGMDPLKAGIEGSKEIFFAIISTTITLVAVFFPIVFLEGMTGRLFREFSIVVAGSILISAFVALTFSPMLATKILKKNDNPNWLYRKSEPFFQGVNSVYGRALNWFLGHKILVFPILILTVVIIGYFMGQISSEMAPLEDRSSINIRTTSPEGATFEYIRDYTQKVSHMADSVVPERQFNIERIFSSGGSVRLVLPDIKDRERSQMEIADALTLAVRQATEARAFVQQQSTFGGRRASMPIQYVLQAQNISKLEEFIPLFMQKVNESPLFIMADVNIVDTSSPPMTATPIAIRPFAPSALANANGSNPRIAAKLVISIGRNLCIEASCIASNFPSPFSCR